LLTTPSRFAKINQTKTWNAGNGSPDAICFWVDRAGITIAGCGVFAGVGNYEYELELLAEVLIIYLKTIFLFNNQKNMYLYTIIVYRKNSWNLMNLMVIVGKVY
jgi:hypothetical protein